MGSHRREIVIACIGALATIAAAVLGAWIAGAKAESSATAVTISIAGQTVAVNSTAASVIQTNVDALQSENAALQASLATAATTTTLTVTTMVFGTPSGSPPPTGLPAGVSLRNSGSLIMPKEENAQADLDSIDPKWTVLGDPFDLRYSTGSLYLGQGTSAMYVGDTIPTYEYCATQSGYYPGFFPRSATVPDSWYCLKTSGKRFAVMHLKTTDGDQTVFDVTVYDPPFA